MALKTRLEKLKEVAEDLNATMKLDPSIGTDIESAKNLKQAIKEEMGTGGANEAGEPDGSCQLYDTDQQTLKDETWEYLTDTLGIEPKTAEAAAPSPDKPKKSETVQKKEEEKVGKKKTAKKTAAKKAPAKKKAAPAKTNGDNTLSIGEAKDAVRKLLMAGKKLTKDEIVKELKITPKRAGDALSFLKNAKYANGRPLNILKNDDKQFHLDKKKKYLD